MSNRFFGGMARSAFFRPGPWTRLLVTPESLSLVRPFARTMEFDRQNTIVTAKVRRGLGEWRGAISLSAANDTMLFFPLRYRAALFSLEGAGWVVEAERRPIVADRRRRLVQLGLVVCTAVLAVYLALRQSGFIG